MSPELGFAGLSWAQRSLASGWVSTFNPMRAMDPRNKRALRNLAGIDCGATWRRMAWGPFRPVQRKCEFRHIFTPAQCGEVLYKYSRELAGVDLVVAQAMISAEAAETKNQYQECHGASID